MPIRLAHRVKNLRMKSYGTPGEKDRSSINKNLSAADASAEADQGHRPVKLQ
jgi:hypothetical protein